MEPTYQKKVKGCLLHCSGGNGSMANQSGRIRGRRREEQQEGKETVNGDIGRPHAGLRWMLLLFISHGSPPPFSYWTDATLRRRVPTKTARMEINKGNNKGHWDNHLKHYSLPDRESRTRGENGSGEIFFFFLQIVRAHLSFGPVFFKLKKKVHQNYSSKWKINRYRFGFFEPQFEI